MRELTLLCCLLVGCIDAQPALVQQANEGASGDLIDSGPYGVLRWELQTRAGAPFWVYVPIDESAELITERPIAGLSLHANLRADPLDGAVPAAHWASHGWVVVISALEDQSAAWSQLHSAPPRALLGVTDIAPIRVIERTAD